MSHDVLTQLLELGMKVFVAYVPINHLNFNRFPTDGKDQKDRD